MNNSILQLFNNDKIPLTWKSIFVGRKLSLAKNDFIEAFATEYLIEYPAIYNLEINELAYGIPDTYQGNLDIQDLLAKIAYSFSIKIPKEESDEWYIESRKWRYMLLKKATQEKLNNKELLDEIENIYCDFEHPVELVQFISYMPKHYYENNDDSDKSIAKCLNQFLEKEKHEITQGI